MSKKPSAIDYDPYELLGLEKEADANAVKKAYRKAARKWHPDKNPEPKATETFRKVQEAFELLADDTARAAYDHVVAAKAAKKTFVAERRANEDAKRRKFREELEKREAAASEEDEEAKAAKELAREIARLRKEGSRLLDEENERLRRKMEAEEDENRRRRHAAQARKPTTSSAPRKAAEESSKHTLKIKCKPSDGVPAEEDFVHEIFAKYGEISIFIPTKKNQFALEYENIVSALEAAEETGTDACQIKVSWLQGKPEKPLSPKAAAEQPKAFAETEEDDVQVIKEISVPKGFAFGTTHEEFDAFEAAILAQMNAPSRKRPAAIDDDVQIIE
ncbi:hypothetical protein L596_030572 [Steinernema carpocapsae]|uniref:J domain-containing protein n=1 Tax=Steinernema carpocapsae TaxID=34508 RepID=A0A4U5LPR3_STECR|nr:hypothetical protein L596_030572 [Steinernema carpocapsae]